MLSTACKRSYDNIISVRIHLKYVNAAVFVCESEIAVCVLNLNVILEKEIGRAHV